MNAASPKLSIIVLSWNTEDLLRECLRAVYRNPPACSFEIIVVDNDSSDGSANMVEQEFADVRVKRNATNEGYAAGNNRGIEIANGQQILLLNSDTEVHEGALTCLVEFLDTHPEYGAVAPRLVNADGSVQRGCMRFPGVKVGLLFDSFLDRKFGRTKTIRDYFMEDFDHLHSTDVDQPPGACFLVRSEVIDDIGMLDESLFLFFNDVDFCRRIVDSNRKIHYLAEAKVLHHVGRSTSKFKDFVKVWQVNRILYYRKHFGWRGTLAVKFAVLLRGIEEILRSLCCGGKGEKISGAKQIFGVLREALAT